MGQTGELPHHCKVSRCWPVSEQEWERLEVAFKALQEPDVTRLDDRGGCVV